MQNKRSLAREQYWLHRKKELNCRHWSITSYDKECITISKLSSRHLQFLVKIANGSNSKVVGTSSIRVTQNLYLNSNSNWRRQLAVLNFFRLHTLNYDQGSLAIGDNS
ncbi:hypothetical protein SDJN02_23221, partial [Cucurbita argyrosperma subsp. argyrosperma]